MIIFFPISITITCCVITIINTYSQICDYKSILSRKVISLRRFSSYDVNKYDYPDIHYPISFSRLYNHIGNRYENYGKRNYFLPQFVNTGDILQYNTSQPSDVLIMSGSSDNHIVPLVNCILSAVVHFPASPVLVVDFGLGEESMCILSWMYYVIHDSNILRNTSQQLYYRKYNFSSFPSWMNINDEHLVGGYTWKPISITDALMQWKAILMWHDAGNYINNTFSRAFKYVNEEGLYVPYDNQKLAWGYSKQSYMYLLKHKLTGKIDLLGSTSGAGFMIYDYRNKTIRERVIIPWYQCAFTRKCMMPKGDVCHPKHTTFPEQGTMGVLVASIGIKYSKRQEYQVTPIYWVDRNTTYLIDIMCNSYKTLLRRDDCFVKNIIKKCNIFIRNNLD